MNRNSLENKVDDEYAVKIKRSTIEKIRRYAKTVSISLAILVGVGTCGTIIKTSHDQYNQEVQQRIESYQEIEGTPQSVVLDSWRGYNDLYTVIDTGDRMVSAKLMSGLDIDEYQIDYPMVEALIQSEINDNDQETMSLIGYYEDKIFHIVAMDVNGHSMEYRTEKFIQEN